MELLKWPKGKIPEYKYSYHNICPDHPWVLLEKVRYYSERYKKFVVLERYDRSDGATGAIDIPSLGWWVHDKLCKEGVFEDKTKCTNWQASMILHDILKDENRIARAKYWLISTWLFGGGKARKNGMW